MSVMFGMVTIVIVSVVVFVACTASAGGRILEQERREAQERWNGFAAFALQVTGPGVEAGGACAIPINERFRYAPGDEIGAYQFDRGVFERTTWKFSRWENGVCTLQGHMTLDMRPDLARPWEREGATLRFDAASFSVRVDDSELADARTGVLVDIAIEAGPRRNGLSTVTVTNP
jgi:hypothetical protein